jgi:hypothetical protein
MSAFCVTILLSSKLVKSQENTGRKVIKVRIMRRARDKKIIALFAGDCG